VVADVLNAAATAGRFAASTTCNTIEEVAP
jgi:hypothetical protein